jgi:hypothetical protein
MGFCCTFYATFHHVLRHTCCYDAHFVGHMGGFEEVREAVFVLIYILHVTIRLICKTLPNETNVSVLTGIRLCLVVTVQTITRTLLFFVFHLASLRHWSSVIGKKHVGQNVNKNTWYKSQRCDMKESQRVTTHVVCGIISRLIKSTITSVTNLFPVRIS